MRALFYFALYALDSAAKAGAENSSKIVELNNDAYALSPDGPGMTSDSSSLYDSEGRITFGGFFEDHPTLADVKL